MGSFLAQAHGETIKEIIPGTPMTIVFESGNKLTTEPIIVWEHQCRNGWSYEEVPRAEAILRFIKKEGTNNARD